MNHSTSCFLINFLCISCLFACSPPDTDASQDLALDPGREEGDMHLDQPDSTPHDMEDASRDQPSDMSQTDASPDLDEPGDMRGEDASDMDTDRDMEPPRCERPTGWFPDQTIFWTFDTSRHYALYVPESINQRACDQPIPVLFDFHGASGGPAPELVFQLEGALDLADAHGIILIRPRGTPRRGQPDFLVWEDFNADKLFLDKLFERLERDYVISPETTFAMGFSNGTFMTSRILQEQDARFAGIASIGGGFAVSQAPFGQSAHRVYLSTGYRDAYGPETDTIARQTPEDLLHVSPHAGCHNLRPFHYTEAWAHWMGESLDERGDLTPWRLLAAPADALSALSIHQLGQREILLGAYSQTLDDQGTSRTLPSAPNHPVSACVFTDGVTSKLLVVDGYRTYIGESVDTMQSVSALSRASYPYAVACDDDRIAVEAQGEVWVSNDAGHTFSVQARFPSYVFSLDADYAEDTGTYVSVGSYLSMARISPAGGVSTPTAPGQLDYVNDLHIVQSLGSNTWIAAGTSGIVLRSIDDGASFSQIALPLTMDVYALARRGDDIALVGDHGHVVLSQDLGLTWTDLSIDTHEYLGAAKFEGNELIVYGEEGFAAALKL